MSDLVSRVLSAITRLERAAEEAKGNPARPGTWVSGPRRDHPGYEVADLTSGWVHTQTHGSAQSHHMAVNDPESVLRLCRSLRDIVEHYVATVAARDRLRAIAASPAPISDMDAHWLRRAESEVIGQQPLVRAVARGLGIEDTPGEADHG